MQKAIVIDRSSNYYLDPLNKLLSAGWLVDKMEAFHPALAVSSGGHSYGEKTKIDSGMILVILDDMGLEVNEEEE